ncbi:MAG TPA: segregation/condensation protein A [Myxococcota bacterium]|nr:segregation/condensation protein A [Myxococcota bacterium]
MDSDLTSDGPNEGPGERSREASAMGRFSCAVKLPAFEGPLDLLLHLIRANEVDIADIPIALISEQYLAYLELMRMLDLDVAADYLLMAATLAHIKSRLLLPPDPELLAEDGLGDPRAELARRLAEYARYKDAANELARRPLLGRDVFTGAADSSELPEKEGVLVVSLFGLLEAMQSVLARIPAEQARHTVARERLTLQECMVSVMDALRAADPASVRFEELLLSPEPTRERVVLAFLSILELAKIQALLIFQNVDELGRPQGPIRVRLAVGNLDDAAISEAGARADAEMAARQDEGETDGGS